MARVSTSRAPLAPIGWPEATAPPLGVDDGLVQLQLLGRAQGDGEGLVDLDQVQVGEGDPARRQASAMARDGWECRLVSSPATDP